MWERSAEHDDLWLHEPATIYHFPVEVDHEMLVSVMAEIIPVVYGVLVAVAGDTYAHLAAIIIIILT